MMAQPDVNRPDALNLRIISAAVMVPAGLAVVWAGGLVLFLAGLMCAGLMWFEYWKVTTKTEPDNVMYSLGAGMALSLLATIWFGVPVWICFAALFLGSLPVFMLTQKPRAIWLASGLVLIGFAVYSLNFLREGGQEALLLTLVVMAGVWITDIAAYFAGRGFGGPALPPRGSPNKTWSGAVGAIICTALLGALVAGLIGGPMLAWIVFLGSVSLLGQLGDLGESYWKRHFGVKDSGTLIPGHGGIIDRLDSFSTVLIACGLISGFKSDFFDQTLGLNAL